MSRYQRQLDVVAWVVRVFGADTMQLRERGARVVEEAIEVAQAVGLTRADVERVVVRVFSKAAGAPSEELGDLGIAMLAFAGAIGASADVEEDRALVRIRMQPDGVFRDRYALKQRDGVTFVDGGDVPEALPGVDQ